jgi:hypothetical protein
MCGLKSMPVAGKAFEVIEAVQSRHAMLAQGERLDEIERQRSRMDLRLRNLIVSTFQSSGGEWPGARRLEDRGDSQI